MSDNQHKTMQDKSQVIQNRSNHPQYSIKAGNQIKMQILDIEQKERLKEIDQSLQGKNFLQLTENNSQIQQNSQEVKNQFNESREHFFLKRHSLKRKMLDEMTNTNPSVNQKQNQNLKTLQQIEEFALQGKKIQDLPEKTQFFLAPYIQKKKQLEYKNKLNQAKKLINKSIDFSSQTSFPSIMKKQKINQGIQNQYPQNFPNQLNINIKSKIQNNAPQIQEHIRKEKRQEQDTNQKLQKIKEQNVNRFVMKEDLKVIDQNKENKNLIENNSHLNISKLKINKSKRDISQALIRE